MIEIVFDLCVQLLLYLAELFGTTYKAINVWIFVSLWPIATLALLGLLIGQQLRIRKLLREIDRSDAGKL
jgi:hypothetical protein